MSRPGKVRRLPKELKEQLNSMLESGRTLDEITAHLKKLGADVSRSGLGRYAQGYEKIMENLRRSREAAEAVVGRLGQGADEGTIGRALTQMVQTLAFDYISRRADDPEAEMEISEIYQMARTVRQSVLAGRAGQEHQVKTREVLRDEAAEAAGEQGPVTVTFEESGL